MVETDWRRQVERESRNGSERPGQAPNDTETPSPLSTFNGDPGVLGGDGVLKYSPARRAGVGAGPAGGRGLGAEPQLHLQERTIMLDSCSTLGLRPT